MESYRTKWDENIVREHLLKRLSTLDRPFEEAGDGLEYLTAFANQYTCKANTYSAIPANTMSTHLSSRKESLFTSWYNKGMVTIHAASFDVVFFERDNSAMPSKGRIDCFASMMRSRQLLVSMWCHMGYDRSPLENNSQFDLSKTVSLASTADDILVNVDWPSLTENPVSFYPPISNSWVSDNGAIPLTLLFADLMTWAKLFWHPVFHPRRTEEEQYSNVFQESDVFSAIVATLNEPVPDTFPTSRDLVECKNKNDWHCQAAALLPYVLSAPENYFPDYLHQLLGVDLSDISSAHYFVGQRVILSLAVRKNESAEDMTNLNLITWTQFLSENAAAQLNALRIHNLQLETSLHESRGFITTRTIWGAKSNRQLDYEEFYNISIAKNPIFWKHLEALKEQSGITALQASAENKLTMISEISSGFERRVLTLSAQGFGLVFGVFGVARLVLSVFQEFGYGNQASLIWSTIIGFVLLCFGTIALWWLNRKV